MVSLSVTLIVIELALRIFLPPDSPRPFEFRIPHPTLGWVLQPNTTYVNQLPEGTVTVTYNSQGWRDLEHEVEKPEGVFRILVLGDSFMEALQVEYEESLAGWIERESVSTFGAETAVRNAAVGGWDPPQYLIRARQLLGVYVARRA